MAILKKIIKNLKSKIPQNLCEICEQEHNTDSAYCSACEQLPLSGDTGIMYKAVKNKKITKKEFIILRDNWLKEQTKIKEQQLNEVKIKYGPRKNS